VRVSTEKGGGKGVGGLRRNFKTDFFRRSTLFQSRCRIVRQFRFAILLYICTHEFKITSVQIVTQEMYNY
jgi:hypothetical protein